MKESLEEIDQKIQGRVAAVQAKLDKVHNNS